MRTIIALIVFIALAPAATAQDWAKAQLDKSRRHQEWVKIKHGNREVNSFIVYPEVKDKATSVIVIHEIFGLTDWVRSVADQLAEAGYIAIAPDLLSGMGSGGGGTEKFPERNAVMQAIRDLPADQITADLNATADYLTKQPAANGKIVVGGFCWGGRQTFRYAANNKNLKAAYVFYGDAPTEAEMSRIACPVYGFYGGNDARITSAVPTVQTQMQKAGKGYDPVTYVGAGHGFMRSGEQPNPPQADKVARDAAWKRWKELLQKAS